MTETTAAKPALKHATENAFFTAAVGLAACTLAGFIGGLYWFFDLFSHFRPYYALCALFLTIAVLSLKMKKTAFLNLAVLLINTVIVAIVLLPQIPDRTAHSPPVLTAVAANVLSVNRQYRFADTLLRQFDADLFLMLETTEEWEQETAYLQERFPHSAAAARDDNFGLLFFSKYRFAGGVTYFSFGHNPAITLPYIKAEFKDTPLNQNMRPLVFYGLHTTPPVSKLYADYRNALMAHIAAEIAAAPEKDAIVAGDLNDTAWSHNFHHFLKTSGLKMTGTGMSPTWPAAFPPALRLQIDHALVKGLEDFQAKLITGEKIGSDHLPVILQIVPKD